MYMRRLPKRIHINKSRPENRDWYLSVVQLMSDSHPAIFIRCFTACTTYNAAKQLCTALQPAKIDITQFEY